ncbi:MAG: CDP-alcohol phosphatidyltransferase family protein [Limisphaerales bacterium]
MTATPAVILAAPATAGLRVAALTLLDRLLVTLHRAGCGPITVVAATPPPGLRRAPALGVKFQTVAAAPARLEADTLVAETGLLTNVADVRRVIAAGGRLTTRDGQALPMAVLPAGTPWTAPAAEEGRRGAALPVAVRDVPRVAAEGVSLPVADAAEARAAGRVFWAALSSSSDGMVDRWFNRPVGRPFAKLLATTPVTPNTVSVASILVGLAGAACFAAGTWAAAVLGALLFQLSAVIDCMDGDIARSVFKESPLGKWLDIAGDQVVHLGVFLGIAAGLARAGSPAPVGWLAASCAVGAGIAFAVVLRSLLRPELRGNGRLQRLIDLTTNRDFSVLVLALALAGRLEWFLWLAAVGAHAFWVLVLALQFASRRANL